MTKNRNSKLFNHLDLEFWICLTCLPAGRDLDIRI